MRYPKLAKRLLINPRSPKRNRFPFQHTARRWQKIAMLAISLLPACKHRNAAKSAIAAESSGVLFKLEFSPAAASELYNKVDGHPIAGTDCVGAGAVGNTCRLGMIFCSAAPEKAVVHAKNGESVDFGKLKICTEMVEKKVVLDDRLRSVQWRVVEEVSVGYIAAENRFFAEGNAEIAGGEPHPQNRSLPTNNIQMRGESAEIFFSSIRTRNALNGKCVSFGGTSENQGTNCPVSKVYCPIVSGIAYAQQSANSPLIAIGNNQRLCVELRGHGPEPNTDSNGNSWYTISNVNVAHTLKGRQEYYSLEGDITLKRTHGNLSICGGDYIFHARQKLHHECESPNLISATTVELVSNCASPLQYSDQMSIKTFASGPNIIMTRIPGTNKYKGPSGPNRIHSFHLNFLVSPVDQVCYLILARVE